MAEKPLGKGASINCMYVCMYVLAKEIIMEIIDRVFLVNTD